MKARNPAENVSPSDDQQPGKQPVPVAECWSYTDVLRNLDVGIIIVDRIGQTIDLCNAAAQSIMNPAGHELTFQRLVCDLLYEDCELFCGELTYTSRTIQRGSRILGFTIYPISHRHFCILLRDITDKIRLESIAQAVNTMDNIGLIFSGIRHEIGNPLNSIKMTISVLRKNLDTFSKDTIRQYVDRTELEVSRMEYLLKSLKNFSMYEKMEIKSYDLAVFLDKLESLIAPDFLAKGIHLTFERLAVQVQVLMDPRALHQAMLNLLANAADALVDRPEPSILIRIRTHDHLIWLEIEDNGCGMTDAEQKLLFQPFCTNKPHGNGLGLMISKKLLAKMNASLEVYSTEGKGTRVRMGLPLS
jgi:signal transduction histidine kinase